MKTCLQTQEEVTKINFETFVRVFALLLEENMNKLDIPEPQAQASASHPPESGAFFVKKLNP